VSLFFLSRPFADAELMAGACAMALRRDWSYTIIRGWSRDFGAIKHARNRALT
jgi:hypothetical protein